MPLQRKPRTPRPLGDIFMAPKGGFRRYQWVVLGLAVVLEVVWVLVNYWTDTTIHPLAPAGAGLVFISVAAGGLGGIVVGVVTAVVGAIAALVLLGDFSSATAAANAVSSAVIWCGAAAVTGLVMKYLERQVVRREAALGQALSRSLSARQQMERVLEFVPHFHESEDVAEVARTIVETAMETFGADGARLYAMKGDAMEILAIFPVAAKIGPGFTLSTADFPDLGDIMASHRPSFLRDVRSVGAKGRALDLHNELQTVSAVRIPIGSPPGGIGLLALGWTHPIERPADELMAIMQRFADQAGLAWQNALRAEAQRRADAVHETLERVVALAPSFHITGTQEEVAQAICEAALVTFECSGAALYRIEGDRLRVLDGAPRRESLPPGRIFPLSADMPLVKEIRSRTPTFVPDVTDPSRSVRPWPPEVMQQVGTRSAMYVPLRFDDRGPQNLLVLNWDQPREQPDDSFLVIVERFADQVALALSSASADRLHARLEASLLPTTPIIHPQLEVITRYRTGEQRLRLGGDFLGSALTGERRLEFVIGDVSGHGPDAAALGATLRSTWKALASAGENIPKTVSVMRQILVSERTEPNIFATICAGRIDLDERSVTLVNAGHLPPLLIGRDVFPLDTIPVSPLGVGMSNDFWPYRFSLPDKWSLFCYTDGLIDVRVSPESSERYGEARLKRRLNAWVGPLPDAAALDALMTEIETASGGHFGDDVAILLVTTKNGDGTPPS